MSLPSFGVAKPVPVNLLMAATILAGIYSALTLRRQFFPEVEPESAYVELTYPGASPEELEQRLAVQVEDKLVELDEVDELTTTLSEGGGGIIVQFREDLSDIDQGIDEIERAIDSLTDLPEDSEKIRVREHEARFPIIRVAAYGDADEKVLKRVIVGARDDLRTLPGMGEITLGGVREYEIRVDVRLDAIIEQGMSLPQIADAIRDWMTKVPSGTVRSRTRNVNVRTLGVSERAKAIRQIVLRANPDGQALRLEEMAEVTESFVDEQVITSFDGKPSMHLAVFKVGDVDIIHIAEMVRAYVAGRLDEPFEPRGMELVTRSKRQLAHELGAGASTTLPAGIQLATNFDFSRYVEGRLQLLTKNALYGAMLVFGTLLLFLNWRVALWCGVGLATAILGTLVLMTWVGETLNFLTMFGLIVVIGLLVDDAIVVSENIQSRFDQGDAPLLAAVKGTEQVFWPVVATVLTSVTAFIPLSFIRGQIGDLMGALPMVVACALSMSLVESLLILPSHMGHSLVARGRTQQRRISELIRRFESWRDHVLFHQIVPAYAKLLEAALRHRYLSATVALSILILSLGMVVGGRISYRFLADSDAETIMVEFRMAIGTPIERTSQIAAVLEDAARAQVETQGIVSLVGQRENIDTSLIQNSASHIAQIFIELKAVEARDRSSNLVIDSMRHLLEGKLEGVDRIEFTEISGGPSGADISLQVRGDDEEQLHELVAQIKQLLSEFEGIHDIADDNTLGQSEVQITLRPDAAALGFSTAQVARQIRGALYGLDAHVFSAEGEDIDVRVRLDDQYRRSLWVVENAWLISPAGKPVPLTEIAQLNDGLTYSTIKRVDRKRSVTVSADTAPGVSPEAVAAQLPLERLRNAYPGLDIRFVGRQKQQQDAFASLPYGFLAALTIIYVILAWLFSSYGQPIAVMLAIPFGLVGVIWGHLICGFDLTFLSLIGFVALSGIVVNDSLILVQFFNGERANGTSMHDALIAAGRQRLRPILLTTLTTVLGLTPLMLEQSFQARFLIPMAIAISFGLMSTTMLILLVLPCTITIIDDLKAATHFLWHGSPRARPPV